MILSKLFALIAVLAAALSIAGMMVFSAIELRATVRLEPEMERLALDYLREEERRREYGRKVDEANRAAEQSFNLLDTQTMDAFRNATPGFDLSPKHSPHVTPRK